MIFNGFRSVFSPNSKLGVSFLKYSFSATPSLPKVQVFLALRTEALLGDAGYSWPSSGDGLQQGWKKGVVQLSTFVFEKYHRAVLWRIEGSFVGFSISRD
ncbi:uncharacterized protein LOC115696947 isoform X4 [Cannabis sativa]|uniref:uncharacterized protein LOC115696947 isoform X4 n=1 Tax=Cannabis sativa TaxID=3483 RepID=UPI0011DF9535|nr:uncharacterized protein LOC115696947 isoform X4 [Cannabis sativa]